MGTGIRKTVKEMYNELADLFGRQEHIRLAYLYGSYATGKSGKLSDVDIGVLMDESLGKMERFKLQLNLIGSVGELLGRDRIDLVVMNDTPVSLNYEIIKMNSPLYVRDRGEKVDFEQLVLSRYLDRRFYDKRASSELLKKVAIRGI